MTTQEKIAVDVVLLPSQEIINRAIEINRELRKQWPEGYINFDNGECLPHLSLAMGVLEKNNVPAAKNILEEVAENYSELSLSIDKIDTAEDATLHEIISVFRIKNTPTLQKLHEVLMERLSKYLTYDAQASMFATAYVKEGSIRWVNTYREKSSYQHFSPHITLGAGKVERIKLPIVFRPSKLAICHLGNYCTCRKILDSVVL